MALLPDSELLRIPNLGRKAINFIREKYGEPDKYGRRWSNSYATVGTIYDLLGSGKSLKDVCMILGLTEQFILRLGEAVELTYRSEFLKAMDRWRGSANYLDKIRSQANNNSIIPIGELQSASDVPIS